MSIEEQYLNALSHKKTLEVKNKFDIKSLHKMPKFFNWVTCEVASGTEFMMYLAGGDDGIALRFFWNGCYEPFSTKIWAHYSKNKKNIIIDIGSHTGAYTLTSLACGAKNVVSFEPYFMNFSRQLMNIRGNGFNTEKIFMLGIGDANRTEVLSVSTSLDYLSTGGKIGARTGSMNFPVNIVAIDNFFELQIHKIDMIKIDVEGYEDKVLSGAKRTIEKNLPILFFECLSNEIGDLVYKQLKPLGYKFWEIDDSLETITLVDEIKAAVNLNGEINMSKLNRIASCSMLEIDGIK